MYLLDNLLGTNRRIEGKETVAMQIVNS